MDFASGLDLTGLQIATLVALVFLAGFVDSIAGGGGLISLPAYFAMGLPAHTALATNKFSSFTGTLAAVFRYYKAGKVRLKLGFLAAGGALIGSAGGTRIALMLDAPTIQSMMLVLIPSVTLFFLLKDRILPKPKDGEQVRHPMLISTLIGFVVGAYDGLFGPGTGTFLAIGFYAFLRLNLIEAGGNARLANLASNFGSLVVFLINGKVLFPLALLTAAGGVAGNQLGSRLALKKGERIVRPLMLLVLLLLMATVVRQRLMG